MEKAKRFIKEEPGPVTENWRVSGFAVIVDPFTNIFYYKVSFTMMPLDGCINGMPGTFHIYLSALGEIKFQRIREGDAVDWPLTGMKLFSFSDICPHFCPSAVERR